MAGDTKRGVFVGDLHESVTEIELEREFSKCGVVLDCRVIRDLKGRSKKFGFINFKDDSGRINALHSMNGAFINGTQVNVRDKRYKDSDKIVIKLGARPSDLYCGNIPQTAPPEEIKRELQTFFSVYNFVEVRVMKKGYCFISFASPGEALLALEAIRSQTNMMLLGKIVIVQGNRSPDSNGSTLGTSGLTIEQLEVIEKAKRTLFVGNLPASLGCDEDRLSEVFQKLVDVKQSMIVKNEQTGQSMGYAFVELPSADLAESVVQRASELVVDGTTLTAQISKPPKELQALLVQRRPYAAQPQYFQDPNTGQYYVLSSQVSQLSQAYNNPLPGRSPLQPQQSYPPQPQQSYPPPAAQQSYPPPPAQQSYPPPPAPKPVMIPHHPQPVYPHVPQPVLTQHPQPVMTQRPQPVLAPHPQLHQPGYPIIPTQPRFAPY